MRSRGWQIRVLAGLALLLLAATLAVSGALQLHRRGQPPAELGVDVAVARVLAGETLDNVRLTDLTDLCRPSLLHRGRRYDRAVGPRGEHGPRLLLEIPIDEECTDDTPHTLAVVGSLVDARRTWQDLDALDHPHAVLHMHRTDVYALTTLLVALLLGATLLHRGLRLRRTAAAN